jgi:hypothetical protein
MTRADFRAELKIALFSGFYRGPRQRAMARPVCSDRNAASASANAFTRRLRRVKAI